MSKKKNGFLFCSFFLLILFSFLIHNSIFFPKKEFLKTCTYLVFFLFCFFFSLIFIQTVLIETFEYEIKILTAFSDKVMSCHYHISTLRKNAGIWTWACGCHHPHRWPLHYRAPFFSVSLPGRLLWLIYKTWKDGRMFNYSKSPHFSFHRDLCKYTKHPTSFS